MFFLTTSQCEAEARAYGISSKDLAKWKEKPRHRKKWPAELFFGDPPILAYELAGVIASWLHDFDHVVFWVVENGIWHENLHLYYRLKASYGDFRQLGDARGHYFHSFERADLVTFLHLALEFGWGGYLLSADTRMFISHDGWLVVYSETQRERILKDIRTWDIRTPKGETQRKRGTA